MTISTHLFKHIDNSALIVFRIIFGLLCFLESVGAVFTGWIKTTLIEPKFTFSFIGFEWLQPLPGHWMYVYYILMGGFGLLIMLGYKYRFSIIAFTLLWTATYLMQKASYNNHYYLLILISALMAVLPAHRNVSLDAKYKPSIKSISMPNWCRLIIIIQLAIVYTYAAIAKLYPDWLDGTVVKILMQSKANYFLIGPVLQQDWLQLVLTYGGIAFDALIIPLLLYKRTRNYAFVISIVFHLFNAIVFQIGIFPFLSLAFTVFFFSSKTIHRIFLKRKVYYTGNDIIQPQKYSAFIAIGVLYFIVQIAFPLRHHFISDRVLWTEEGHRMSWRMMLRTKYGQAEYHIKNHSTGEIKRVDLNHYLTVKQQGIAKTKPDVMWQFAQYLKKAYAKKGDSISVYVSAKISVNGKSLQPLINSETDLAATKWNYFSHQAWILPSKP